MILSKRVIIAATIVAMGVFSCTDEFENETTREVELGEQKENINSKSSVDASRDTAEIKNELDPVKMLALINEKRAEGCNCGDTYMEPVAPLEWDSTLEVAALQHTQDMVTNKFLSHQGSDGLWAGDRLNALGYSWWTWGENVARGYFESEEEVMQAWLNSAGHCSSIMSPDFTEVGAAEISDPDTYNSWFGYQNYWTQVFARPGN